MDGWTKGWIRHDATPRGDDGAPRRDATPSDVRGRRARALGAIVRRGDGEAREAATRRRWRSIGADAVRVRHGGIPNDGDGVAIDVLSSGRVRRGASDGARGEDDGDGGDGEPQPGVG
jgi:hypothetical protein